MEIIKTINENWLEDALKCYKDMGKFKIIDNAKIGLNMKDVESGISIIKAAKTKGNYTWKQITGILIGLGLSAAGIYVIGLAIADPEPTSKLTLLIAGGMIITLTGGAMILLSLGYKFDVTVFYGNNKFLLSAE